MRLVLSVFILFSLCVTVLPARAELYRREVSFEWEENVDAKSYDVEIRQVGKEAIKPLTFKTKTPIWTGKLLPGKYTMSLRARDSRGVPGDWNAPSEFVVNLDPVKLKTPLDKAQIKSDDGTDISQKFDWAPVPGASEYHFELTSEDGKTKVLETLKDTTYTAKIPVAQTYTVKVTGFGQNEMQSDSTTVATFTVMGKKLAAPKIITPETEFVREVKWARPDNAEKFDLVLMKYNPQIKKWEKVLVQENFDGDTFSFDADRPGGTYRLQVKAHGNLRDTSENSQINFKVTNGNRSPAAEYTALVRKSIDRVTGWYGIASYLVTQINYHGETPETGGLTTTTAMGGTGRLGAGYFNPNEKWGFLGIVDMSGFTISGGSHTYSSIELSGISRHIIGELGEGRLFAGVYYKELPQLIGSPSLVSGTPATVDFVQSAVAGPHVGAEYWHSLSPKIGFQVNTHLYYSMLTAKSPNGNSVEPRMSYQLGLMGSYRWNNHFTGLMGITHRVDEIAYKANKTGSILEGSGSYDETRITGDYLSFYTEYGF